jgi:hypothetical protein
MQHLKRHKTVGRSVTLAFDFDFGLVHLVRVGGGGDLALLVGGV